MFLSRNYRLIGAPRKFDVLKINICREAKLRGQIYQFQYATYAGSRDGAVEGAGMAQWREQGWRSGESARLQLMCPRFDSRTQRHMWVEFVDGSLACKFQFDLELIVKHFIMSF